MISIVVTVDHDIVHVYAGDDKVVLINQVVGMINDESLRPEALRLLNGTEAYYEYEEDGSVVGLQVADVSVLNVAQHAGS